MAKTENPTYRPLVRVRQLSNGDFESQDINVKTLEYMLGVLKEYEGQTIKLKLKQRFPAAIAEDEEKFKENGWDLKNLNRHEIAVLTPEGIRKQTESRVAFLQSKGIAPKGGGLKI